MLSVGKVPITLAISRLGFGELAIFVEVNGGVTGGACTYPGEFDVARFAAVDFDQTAANRRHQDR